MTRIYLMWNMRLPLRMKIGITNNIRRREKENRAITFFNVPMPFAEKIESAMHRAYKPFHWPAPRHYSGFSEYFYCCNPLAALLFFNLQLWYGILPDAPPWAPFAVLVFPFPLDALLILLLVTALFYIGIPAAIIGLIYGANLLNLHINA